jgi:hypothetical protein
LAVISSLGAAAQSEEVKERVNSAKDRFVFEFNINQMIRDKSTGFDLDGFSGGFGTYFMYDVVIKESPISLAPGIGVGADNYRHNSQIVFTDTTTNFVPFADSIGYKKSKLGVTYIDIPFEIRFRSKPNNNNWQWKLAAGFKFGFLVGSKWKYKGNEFRGIRNDTESTIKFKEHGIPNLERFRYGATARGGFGPFNLHFYYSLSNLFEDGKSVDMQPITFGLSINGL